MHCGSIKKLNSLTNKPTNKTNVDLTVVFLRTQEGKSIYILQSTHLIMQLFEIRGQVLKVIKDSTHGRLAGEYEAMSKRSKQQLKNLNRNTQLKASNHVRDVGPK